MLKRKTLRALESDIVPELSLFSCENPVGGPSYVGTGSESA